MAKRATTDLGRGAGGLVGVLLGRLADASALIGNLKTPRRAYATCTRMLKPALVRRYANRVR
jgi:hypothetical protein